MIEFSKSNVFNVKADAIVNTVNCVGFMGKGLALECAIRYPELLKDYKEKCDKNIIKVGTIDYFLSEEINVINFPTKVDYKYPSKLEWIEKGLKDFVNTYKKYNFHIVAFPLIGCNNGKLNSKIVIDLMTKYLKDLDIKVIICTNEVNPEGKELEMIESFKKTPISTLCSYVNLNYQQKDELKKLQTKIKRFNDILNANKIGITTYKNIFMFFFKNLVNEEKQNDQLSLF